MDSSRENTGANPFNTEHNRGESFRLLKTWLADLPHGRALDIGRGACCAGEMIPGLILRKYEPDTRWATLSDSRMLAASGDAHVLSNEADTLPYADGTFTLVTCLLAAQYASDVTASIQEASRVLKPGGVLALIDTLTDPEPRIARAVNTIEAFRDRRHRWAYSLPDWEVFFHLAGLLIERSAVVEVRQDLDDWGVSAGMDDLNLMRLRAILMNGPTVVKGALMPEKRGLSVTFSRQEIVLLGRKSS